MNISNYIIQILWIIAINISNFFFFFIVNLCIPNYNKTFIIHKYMFYAKCSIPLIKEDIRRSKFSTAENYRESFQQKENSERKFSKKIII